MMLRDGHRRDAVLAGLYGSLLSLALLTGGMLEREGALLCPSGSMIAVFLLRAVLISGAVLLFWRERDRRRLRRSPGGSRDPEKESGQKESRQKESRQKEGGRKKRRLRGLQQGGKRAGRWPEPGTVRGRVLLWTFFMAVQLISLLAVYPGFFVYDAAEELSMVQTRAFTTHHPLLHVLLLGGSILAVHKLTGSYNLGIFCYLLLQMAVIDSIFVLLTEEVALPFSARSVQVGRKSCRTVGEQDDRTLRAAAKDDRCANVRRGAAAVLWLVLCPVVTMFTLCSCKDGLFAAALIGMVLFLRRLPEGRISWREPSARGFVLLAVLMMLLRNNGSYAYAAFVLLLAAGAGFDRLSGRRHRDRDKNNRNRDKNNDKKLTTAVNRAGLYLLPLLLYALLSKGLILATGATHAESQEILTVPIMQLARVWNADPSSFDEGERGLMLQLMEQEDEGLQERAGRGTDTDDGTAAAAEPVSGWDYYNPVLSDQVKLRFRSDYYREHRGDFWRLWLSKGLEHPASYLNAWLMTSYGFWTPGAIIDCYEGNTVFTFTYEGSSYFGYETELPGLRRSRIPALDAWYRFLSLDPAAQRLPGLGWILSPGVMFWAFAGCLLTLLRDGRRRELRCYAPLLLVWLTVLLGPCTLPRYVVYLWFGMPLVAADVLRNTRGMYVQVDE